MAFANGWSSGEGTGHWQYMREEVASDGDLEYQYSGLGLCSNPSAEQLNLPDVIDHGRMPVETSDIESVPGSLSSRRYYGELENRFYGRFPQESLDNPVDEHQYHPVQSFCPNCRGVLNNAYLPEDNLAFQRNQRVVNHPSSVANSQPGYNQRGPRTKRQKSRFRPRPGLNAAASNRTSSTISSLDDNTESITSCSSCSILSSKYPSAVSLSQDSLLPTDADNLVSGLSYRHTDNEHSYFTTSEKENYKCEVPRYIFKSSSQRSSKSKKFDCLITFASDAIHQIKTAANYMKARGYKVMTDIPSPNIERHQAVDEKEVMRKLTRVFRKCSYLLCYLSKEYIKEVTESKAKNKHLHIRVFADLMEDEFKRNGKINKRFLPIYADKNSKLNNLPGYLTSYPKNQHYIYQELFGEALS
ncbi:uncharacterized protein [Antedon mediterranea]|uniref:uncharacterized protein n=1 Tax=Antedon mediterranea TaxID=105859 RepID=UPI003AF49F93